MYLKYRQIIIYQNIFEYIFQEKTIINHSNGFRNSLLKTDINGK